jgi:TRAP transporter TAXI family solute receptor
MRLLRILALLATTLVIGMASAQMQLSIATGGTGGVYYPLGGGLAEVISRHLDGYSAVAEVTGASVENLALIAQGESDIAIALGDSVYQAYTGTGAFEGRQLPNIRAIAAAYTNAVHIVALEGSGITSLEDLRGRRVSVGAPGSGTEVNAQAILEANGMTYDDIEVQRLNFNETAAALRDGDIDAGFWSVGAPTSSIIDLATTHNVTFVELTDEQIDNALAADPTFARTTIPANSYSGQDQDIVTLGIPNVWVVSAEMEDELAYEITRVLFDHADELIAIHPAAESTTVEFTVEATPIPLHPGAIRYFQENGVELPERLLDNP